MTGDDSRDNSADVVRDLHFTIDFPDFLGKLLQVFKCSFTEFNFVTIGNMSSWNLCSIANMTVSVDGVFSKHLASCAALIICGNVSAFLVRKRALTLGLNPLTKTKMITSLCSSLNSP